MTGEKFAEIVTKRANERVQEKIKIFEKAIATAFNNLTGSSTVYKDSYRDDQKANEAILLNMANRFTLEPRDGWPKYLWEKEEEKVTKELLSMMDEMQKALLAPGPKADDCKQEGSD